MDLLRPRLHALVGWYVEPLGLVGNGQYVLLEEALDYKKLGAFVLVDPGDEIDVATYERDSRWHGGLRRRGKP